LPAAGQWPEVPTASTQPATPDPTLDRVEQLIRDNQNKSGRQARHRVVPGAQEQPAGRPRALPDLAGWSQYGDKVKAYYYLDELMDEHPDSRL
jgi:hypothetical protein